MNAAEIAAFFAHLAAANPSPQTELHYRNLFTLLVAVVLSAQATDIAVNKATKALFDVADTPSKMAELGAEGILPYIKTIGLAPTKARNVYALSVILRDQFGGAVPDARESLESLPGVGRKTANVVLNVGFGENTLAVDTHIFRVANRTGLAAGATPLAVELGLLARIPPTYLHQAHHWLILHGRYVCTARAPKCGKCGVRDFCQFGNKAPIPPATNPPRVGAN
ncbi:MAG: endonuclease III [Candidatus Symbiobacter sp.]|nr:endonuclease III [Candidatus Symbiobacter sp.]